MKLDIPRYSFNVSVDEKWAEFAEKWSQVSYEDEAIGLMHFASTLSGSYKQGLELDLINFFVFYASLPSQLKEGSSYLKFDHRYVMSAQTLLMGKVVPSWNSFRKPGSEGAHQELLNCILKPRQALVRAPFHGYVIRYLWHFQDLVENRNFYATKRNESEKTCASAVQHLFPTFVNAMINWEKAEDLINLRELFHFYKPWETKRILEEFYEREIAKDFGGGISYLYSHLTHSNRKYIDIDKRNGWPDKHNVLEKVFIALMGYRYLVEKNPVVESRERFLG